MSNSVSSVEISTPGQPPIRMTGEQFDEATRRIIGGDIDPETGEVIQAEPDECRFLGILKGVGAIKLSSEGAAAFDVTFTVVCDRSDVEERMRPLLDLMGRTDPGDRLEVVANPRVVQTRMFPR